MNRSKVLFIICFVLVICTAGIQVQANQAVVSTQVAQAANQLHPMFRPVINQLKAKTRVPLQLPAYIPQEDYLLYITVNMATPKRYELTIGTDTNCSGGNYCRYGTVFGQRINPSTPSVEEQYAFLNDPSYQPTERSTQKMGRVTLANGIEGYFIPYVCGANCDDSKVIWEQGGYRYLVGIKAGEKKLVVEMANSAISSRAVSPK